MAKLKARGREEIFRIERTRPYERSGVAKIHEYRALMSDGNILGRMVMRYTPEETAKNFGKSSHDYGWKVKGLAKAGLSLEQLLKPYLAKAREAPEAELVRRALGNLQDARDKALSETREGDES